VIRRNTEDSIRLALGDTPVVLLNGPRQTGKTTPARSIAAESGAGFYTFDDATTLALASNDPAGFIP
jgi:predicted AAA+ superfamily ATPase